MKYVAYFALFTGLAAAVAAIVLKARGVIRSGHASRNDKLMLIFLPLFALILIANIILVSIYF